MKRVFLFFIQAGIISTVAAQDFSVGDLVAMSALTPQKFEQAINKKGYAKSDMSYKQDAVALVYQQKVKDPASPRRYAEQYPEGKDQVVVFSTSSASEASLLRQKLISEGFFCGKDSLQDQNKEIIFQKKNIAVFAGRKIENSDTLYSFRFQNKVLPTPGKIGYAEDLLQFDSHQHLVTMFGTTNVIKDQYYFSDNEFSACSVIFPHSSRQAVFIWKDETNLTGLGSVVVGGGLRVGSDIDQVSQVSENNWLLRNGVRPNMKLRTLLELNEADFEVYGKQSPYFLKIAPAEKGKEGKLDFKETTVILGCLNCGGSNALDADMASAEALLDGNMSMHVMIIILSPVK